MRKSLYFVLFFLFFATSCSRTGYQIALSGGPIPDIKSEVISLNNGSSSLNVTNSTGLDAPLTFAHEIMYNGQTIASIPFSISSTIIADAPITYVLPDGSGSIEISGTHGQLVFTYITPPSTTSPIQIDVISTVMDTDGDTDSTTNTIILNPSPNTFTLIGEVNGLMGNIQLTNDAGENINLAADGDFQFSNPYNFGDIYELTIDQVPTGQTCIITDGIRTDTVVNTIAKIIIDCGSPWIVQYGQVSIDPTFTMSESSGKERARGTAVDSEGNFINAGSTKSSMGESLAGGFDAIVTKIKANNAEPIWFSQLGSVSFDPAYPSPDNTGNSFCEAVYVDKNDDVYCSGSVATSVADDLAGDSDLIIMKLNGATGSIDWITQMGQNNLAPNAVSNGWDNNGFATCNDIEVYNGKVYAACVAYGNKAALNTNDIDAIALSLDATTGNIEWVTQFGDSSHVGSVVGDTNIAGLKVDRDNDCLYLAGYTAAELADMSAGNNDILLIKLDLAGTPIWQKQLGTDPANVFAAFTGSSYANDEVCSDVDINSLGEIIMSCFTNGQIADTNTSGNYDLLFPKFDSDGNIIDIYQLGENKTIPTNIGGAGVTTGNEYSLGSNFQIDSDDNILVTFSTDANFAETNAGSNDIVITKFKNDMSIDWVKHLGQETTAPFGFSAIDDEQGIGLVLDDNGYFYVLSQTKGSFSETSGGSIDFLSIKFSANTGDFVPKM